MATGETDGGPRRNGTPAGGEARPRRAVAPPAPAAAAPVDAAPVDAAPVDAAPVDAAPVDAAAVPAVALSGPAHGRRGKAAAASGGAPPSGPSKRARRLGKASRPAAGSASPAAGRGAGARPALAAAAGARGGALWLLAGVRAGRSLADQAAGLAPLPPGERARAQRLAAETLRGQGRADALLAPRLARAPRPAVRDALRLAVTEIAALGAPPHGAVNAAVTAIRRMGPGERAAAGMANAVLRRLADSASADWAALPPPPLPDWLHAPVAAAWGEEAATAIAAAHAAGAPLDLTPRPGRAAPGEALPNGSHRLREAGQVSALPGYAGGDWWIQDAAAAMPARLLAPAPGETVIDLCAAPGGKTLQLAAAGAAVTAVDVSAARLARLRENLARCGLAAAVVTADARVWRPEARADAVLLDAPCSATGTIRRHPDLPHLRDGSGLPALLAAQDALIDAALEMVRPGGRLVYAVCSLLPAEGEARIAAALARHPGLTADCADLPGIEPGWWTPHGLRLRPDFWAAAGGMDGFFMARLQKRL